MARRSPPQAPIDAATRRALRARSDAMLERYLAELEGVRGRSEHTLRNYRNDIGGFFEYLASEGVAFERAGRTHGRAYLARAREAGVAPASIKRIATTIRAFFAWLDREGLIGDAEPGDSILRLRYPKAPRRLPHFLSTEETQALVEASEAETARGRRDRAGSSPRAPSA